MPAARATRGGGLEALLRRGDHVHRVAGEARVAGLGRLEGAALQAGTRGGRDLDARSASGSPARRRRWSESGTVGPLAMTSGASPGTSLISSVTTRAGAQCVASRPPLIAERCLRTQFISSIAAPLLSSALLIACFSSSVMPRRGQRQQRRAAAGDQAQHQVVGRQALRELRDALRGAPAGFVGHRVRGLDDLDAPGLRLVGRRHVVVARDDQAGQRRVLRPQRIDRRGHRAAGLAGADARPCGPSAAAGSQAAVFSAGSARATAAS